MYRNEYEHYEVMTTPKALTGSFVDFGVEINVLSWNILAVYVSLISNNSTAIQIKPLGRYKDSSIWYDLPIKTTTAASTALSTLIYQFSGTDPNMVFSTDVDGLAFVKFQMKGTGNVPAPGIVASIIVNATAR
jgi:hypothetical protein